MFSPTLGIYTQYLSESVVIVDSIDIEILTTSHVLSTPEYEKICFGMPSVCNICTRLGSFIGAPKRKRFFSETVLVKFQYFMYISALNRIV
jgi:hypothetical protein